MGNKSGCNIFHRILFSHTVKYWASSSSKGYCKTTFAVDIVFAETSHSSFVVTTTVRPCLRGMDADLVASLTMQIVTHPHVRGCGREVWIDVIISLSVGQWACRCSTLCCPCSPAASASFRELHVSREKGCCTALLKWLQHLSEDHVTVF